MSYVMVHYNVKFRDILRLTKICNGAYDICWEDFISLKDGHKRENRKIPRCRKPRFESSHNEFCARTSRLLSFLPSIDISRPIGLIPSLLRIFRQYFG